MLYDHDTYSVTIKSSMGDNVRLSVCRTWAWDLWYVQSAQSLLGGMTMKLATCSLMHATCSVGNRAISLSHWAYIIDHAIYFVDDNAVPMDHRFCSVHTRKRSMVHTRSYK